MNKRYVMAFHHDQGFYVGGYSHALYEKYQRRISRFRSLKNYPGKVIFVRIPYDYVRTPDHPYVKQFGYDPTISRISSDEAKRLRDALKQYFPNLNFILVIFNYRGVNTPSIIAIENVIEYRIERYKKKANIKQILQQFQH